MKMKRKQILNYDEVISLLNYLNGGKGVDWYPELYQMILFTTYNNYTYNKNRWDSLNLKGVEYKIAISIKEVEEDKYEVILLNRNEVEVF